MVYGIEFKIIIYNFKKAKFEFLNALKIYQILKAWLFKWDFPRRHFSLWLKCLNVDKTEEEKLSEN